MQNQYEEIKSFSSNSLRELFDNGSEEIKVEDK